jgi:hypothetical protein
LRICLEVAQVSDMTLGVRGSTVVLAEGVDYIYPVRMYPPSKTQVRLTVRSSGSTSVGVVTKLMNVHATLRVCVTTTDVP